MHFQVELCVAAILNHPSSEERPGLQNHDGKPAASNPEEQGEAVETSRTSDPQASIHNALVAHVGGMSFLVSPTCHAMPLEHYYLFCLQGFSHLFLHSSNFFVFLLNCQLFQKCKLVQKILDAWEDNDKIQ